MNTQAPDSIPVPTNPTPKLNEPWRIRPYDLKQEPRAIVGEGGECWVHQGWNILPDNSERSICEVNFSSSFAAWAPTQNRSQAIAYRDRIVACVNACAGMEDPEAEIATLRAQAQVLHSFAVPVKAQSRRMAALVTALADTPDPDAAGAAIQSGSTFPFERKYGIPEPAPVCGEGSSLPPVPETEQPLSPAPADGKPNQ